jgi:hypothetical protein
MKAPATFFHSALAALVGLFSKTPKRAMTGDELRDWINAQPDIAKEARQGFEEIEAGRYRKVSRGGTTH